MNKLSFIVVLGILVASCIKSDPVEPGYDWVKHLVLDSPSPQIGYKIAGFEDKVLLLYGNTKDYHAVIYKSVDRGNSWKYIDFQFNGYFRNLQVIDENTYACSIYPPNGESHSDDTGSYITYDGGKTWKHFASNDIGRNIYFVNRDKVFLFYYNTVYHSMSLDHGNTWYDIAFYTDTMIRSGFEKMIFPEDEMVGYAYGSWDALIYKTTDGGFNWEEIYADPTVIGFGDISMVNNSLGYMSHDFDLFKTINGGASWEKIYTAQESHIVNIWTVGDSTCFFDSNNSLYKSVDGAATFRKMTCTHNESPSNVYFISENEGVAAYSNEVYLYKE